jgi:phytoene dehydrogenase-like protein
VSAGLAKYIGAQTGSFFMAFDAVVIGSGPNGLAAAIELARQGCSVCVFEASSTIGGGARSAEWTLPGFIHDTCSAIHPLGAGSPFFRQLPLHEYGLEWIYPENSVAHALDNGRAIVLERSVERTAQNLGRDGIAYARLMLPFVERWKDLAAELLAPIHIPRNPMLMARFGLRALQSASVLAASRFSDTQARALLAGLAAHSILPLDSPGTAAFSLIFAVLGHAVGWPLPKGGSQKLTDALVAYFATMGGTIVTDTRIDSVSQVPKAKVILCDITPRQLLRLAGDRLPPRYIRKLERFRYGLGVFKVDWALGAPIPWSNSECRRTASLHLGGSLEEIMESERLAANGEISERPFVILAQPTLFDSTRAPSGMHTAWAYCHVPNGSSTDITDRIEAQVERFAPGFRECILSRHTFSAVELEAYNANYVGGDIAGGSTDLAQLIARPTFSLCPYRTPLHNLFICSSSTPPGGGVHGMCGYHAARAALRFCL